MTVTDAPTIDPASLDAGKLIVSMTSDRRFWVGISTGDQDYVGGEDWEVDLTAVIVFDDMGKVLQEWPRATVSVRNIERATEDPYGAMMDYVQAMSYRVDHARQEAQDAAREADRLQSAFDIAREAYAKA